ncbi:uncharacterized protein BP01DRAFT_363302 [Aspergillus saccharolyticus JOP 1030-1]|uniref:Uncharacterized protein n=1 Tax=Aspergillus saccharolyticus JOP 1030-1 TaxID=1450539 RepID=A0A318ZKM8_9EURO|nr:hypothetical protein BP01DRAFT_363302 [Aspergillus saccharolyticus JOP 1030-1]PYH48129.1 hypothetical protein BP01DRAFT_363302 [Aspergillus saccharolyticus JOP 1030-1]
MPPGSPLSPYGAMRIRRKHSFRKALKHEYPGHQLDQIEKAVQESQQRVDLQLEAGQQVDPQPEEEQSEDEQQPRCSCQRSHCPLCEHPPHHTAEDWPPHEFWPPRCSFEDYESQAVCKLDDADITVSPAFCWEDALWQGYTSRLMQFTHATARMGLGTTERLCTVLLDTGAPTSFINPGHARAIPGAFIQPCEPYGMLDWTNFATNRHTATECAVFFVYIPDHLGHKMSRRRWTRIVVRAVISPNAGTHKLILGCDLLAREDIVLDLRRTIGLIGSSQTLFRLEVDWVNPNSNMY